MVRIEFVPRRGIDGRAEIVPVLDGVSLIVLVRDFERSLGLKPLGYAGLVPEFTGMGDLLFRDLLGSAARSEGAASTVLFCECGNPACGDLTTQIWSNDGHVTWSDFSVTHDQRDYSALGPFAFAESQYVEALTAVGGLFGRLSG